MLAIAEELFEVRASRAGFVTSIDALAVGLTGVAMGAGRTRADQPVDPSVGIALEVGLGDAVTSGQVLARLFLRDAKDAAALVARLTPASSRPSLTSPIRASKKSRYAPSGSRGRQSRSHAGSCRLRRGLPPPYPKATDRVAPTLACENMWRANLKH